MAKNPQSNWAHLFEIDSPTSHEKGFTVYKVTSKVFLRNLPETITKVVVWKRYNDFKKLYKELKTIHAGLYLKGDFPEFPKSKLFGRYANPVIEERRRAALNLLIFASGHSQLYSSGAFQKFFQDGYNTSELITYQSENLPPADCSTKEISADCLVPEKLWTDAPEKAEEDEDESHTQTTDDEGAGGGDGDSISSEIFNNNLDYPQLEPKKGATLSTTSTLALEDALSPQIPALTHRDTAPEEPCISQPSSSISQPLSCDIHQLRLSRPPPNISSPNSCSTSSLDSIPKGETSALFTTKHLQESLSSLLDFLPIFPKKVDDRLPDSRALLSESLNESYVCEAANHFTLAQQFESNGEFHESFKSMKAGIQVLLIGAENDMNKNRKALVKKKIEKYLGKAEELHNFIENSKGDPSCLSKRKLKVLYNKYNKTIDINVSTKPRLDQTLPHSPPEELRTFKIVGLASNSLYIVVDTKYSNIGVKCFALKVLQKTNKLNLEQPQNITPKGDFMVQLIKWFNLENSIILLLKYANGGTLKDFIYSYQRKEIPVVVYDENSSNSSQIQQENAQSFENVSNFGIKSNEKDSSGERVPELPESPPNSIKEDHLSNSQIVENEILPERSVLEDEEPFEGPSWLDLDAFDPEVLINNSNKLLQTISHTLAQQRHKSIAAMAEISQDDRNIASISNRDERNEHILNKTNEEKLLCQKEEGSGGDPNGIGMSTPELSNFSIPNQSDPPSTHRVSPQLFSSGSFFPTKETFGDEPPVKRMLPECSIRIWASEIVLALQKLHSYGLAYGDLQMKNILLGENGHILLTYKSHWEEVEQVLGAGNPYSAPELASCIGMYLWKVQPYSDFWSFGVILFELLTGQTVDSIHPEGIHEQTIIRIPEKNICGEEISESAKSILLELLQYSPSLRLGYYGSEEVKTHPFFEGISWEL